MRSLELEVSFLEHRIKQVAWASQDVMSMCFCFGVSEKNALGQLNSESGRRPRFEDTSPYALSIDHQGLLAAAMMFCHALSFLIKSHGKIIPRDKCLEPLFNKNMITVLTCTNSAR